MRPLRSGPARRTAAGERGAAWPGGLGPCFVSVSPRRRESHFRFGFKQRRGAAGRGGGGGGGREAGGVAGGGTGACKEKRPRPAAGLCRLPARGRARVGGPAAGAAVRGGPSRGASAPPGQVGARRPARELAMEAGGSGARGSARPERRGRGGVKFSRHGSCGLGWGRVGRPGPRPMGPPWGVETYSVRKTLFRVKT